MRITQRLQGPLAMTAAGEALAGRDAWSLLMLCAEELPGCCAGLVISMMHASALNGCTVGSEVSQLL